MAHADAPRVMYVHPAELPCCDRCGEGLAGEPCAEIFDPKHPAELSHLVHAEPCATDLIAQGWELA